MEWREREGRVDYVSFPAKLEFSRSFTDWQDLSDLVGVELHRRARFERGREAAGIWEYMEGRGRLAELPGLLRKLEWVELADNVDAEVGGAGMPASQAVGSGAPNRGMESPQRDAWAVAIHAHLSGDTPLGVGVLIDERRVLTCRSVLRDATQGFPLWVTFPKASVGSAVRRAVAEVRLAERTDVAVLELCEPAPTQAQPARLACVAPADLVSEAWWAFGFPVGAPYGRSVHGVVTEPLSYGWVRLGVDPAGGSWRGFGGAGIWSPARSAVVGLIGEVQKGPEHAYETLGLTLHQADLDLPDERISEKAVWSVLLAGESALAAWGWGLETDPEAVQHWRPRARGVFTDAESGYRFRGRRVALATLVDWLDRPVADDHVLVVTGSPGVGKSAVLGRVVTTADADARSALPGDDDNVTATVGCISCAIHAKGKTALEVGGEVARAASIRMPRELPDIVTALEKQLRTQPQRFNIVIDALDEATTPDQARLILEEIILPIARQCGPHGAQVVVGTRRHDDGGPLVALLDGSAHVIDLDHDWYFEEQDLVDYALATLQLLGQERTANPYSDLAVALPVAERIASLAEKNFLIAGLVARQHGLLDTVAVSADALDFPPHVDAVLSGYVRLLEPAGTVSASLALSALAYAEPPGFSLALWQLALSGLGVAVAQTDLRRFVRTAAANYLIESTMDERTTVFRLFHQALNDALLRERTIRRLRAADERGITTAMIALGRQHGWAIADPYLWRSLPAHAGRSGRLDELLVDDDYLRYVDLAQLLPLVDHAATEAGRARARMLQLTPRAVAEAPTVRAAMFSVTAAVEGLPAYTKLDGTPYRARWAHVSHRAERAVLEGHNRTVRDTCTIQFDGRTFLASGGSDATVRLWDPTTGQQVRQLDGHTASVNVVCSMPIQGRTLLATASSDGTVRIWNPATGRQLGYIDTYAGPIRAMCVVQLAGSTFLAIGSTDGVVRLHDPNTAEVVQLLRGHAGPVNALCLVESDGESFLASGGSDAAVLTWNPGTGDLLRRLRGHTSAIKVLCDVDTNGRNVLASGGDDTTIRLWDPASGRLLLRLDGHKGAVNALCSLQMPGRTLIASAGDDTTVRVWNPNVAAEMRCLTGHTGPVNSLCEIDIDRQPLLASGGADATIRVWKPATGRPVPPTYGHADAVNSVSTIQHGRTARLISASSDTTAMVWDVTTGKLEHRFGDHTDCVTASCVVVVHERALFATGGADATIRLWDPATGHLVRTMRPGLTRWRKLVGQPQGIRAVCALTFDGQTVLASVGGNPVVSLWDPHTGHQVGRIDTGPVNALSSATLNGRTLLVTGGSDASVRIWDPTTCQLLHRFDGHTQTVSSVCTIHYGQTTFVASAGNDGTAWLWNLAAGKAEQRFAGHTGSINGICSVSVNGRMLLATASSDRTVCFWHLTSSSPVACIPVHHQALSCATAAGQVIVGLSAGVVALKVGHESRIAQYFAAHRNRGSRS
jgi:WD40 repeat protein